MRPRQGSAARGACGAAGGGGRGQGSRPRGLAPEKGKDEPPLLRAALARSGDPLELDTDARRRVVVYHDRTPTRTHARPGRRLAGGRAPALRSLDYPLAQFDVWRLREAASIRRLPAQSGGRRSHRCWRRCSRSRARRARARALQPRDQALAAGPKNRCHPWIARAVVAESPRPALARRPSIPRWRTLAWAGRSAEVALRSLTTDIRRRARHGQQASHIGRRILLR